MSCQRRKRGRGIIRIGSEKEKEEMEEGKKRPHDEVEQSRAEQSRVGENGVESSCPV